MRIKKLIPFLLWPFLASPAPLSSFRINTRLTELVAESNVEYSKKVRNNLLYLYDGLDREISLCGFGEEQNGKIRVYDLGFPVISKSAINSTRWSNIHCMNREDYIGMVHNHPGGNCEPSDIDINRFKREYRARVETLVCFASISRDSLVVKTEVK